MMFTKTSTYCKFFLQCRKNLKMAIIMSIFRQFKDVAIVFFFTAFCVAAGTALGTLYVAHRKKSPHFVWPRLVFVTGVLIICGIFIILLFLYFSGAASGINDFIINVVEVSKIFPSSLFFCHYSPLLLRL